MKILQCYIGMKLEFKINHVLKKIDSYLFLHYSLTANLDAHLEQLGFNLRQNILLPSAAFEIVL